VASTQTYSFTQLVQNFTAAVQAAATQLVDFSVGSINLAYAQASAAVALWLQGLALTVLGLTRFATSFGSDADSWGADFGFDRLGATFATTPSQTFTRANTSVQATITVGTLINTADGTQQFEVVADATQTAYNAAANAYIIPIGTATITATVEAMTAGTGGNVQANTITQLVAPIAGVDSTTNAAAIANALNAESDPAYKARFPLFLAGLQSGDVAAIEYAITTVQQGIQYLYVDSALYPNAAGTTAGAFYVIVDNGSGSPPTSLLNSVAAAIAAVRGGGIQPAVFAPTVVAPTISLNVRVAAGFVASAVEAAAAGAVVAAVNALGLVPLTLFISAVEAAALATPGVAGVQPGQTKINGSNADLALTLVQTPKITTGNVTVGTSEMASLILLCAGSRDEALRASRWRPPATGAP
jgi:uncharacterized phage protein gp47/JayE